MNRAETLAVNGTLTLLALGFAGIGFLRGFNRWMLHQVKPDEGIGRNHISAVPLNEDILYEKCDCEMGLPCQLCWDEGLKPHACSD
jgi:hypothetical protein